MEIFTIPKGAPCSAVLDQYKKKYDALVAYSPTLSQQKSAYEKVLKGRNPKDIFEKICQTYQLEFVNTSENAFLVRSDADAIRSSEEIIIHYHIRDSGDGTPVSYAAVYDKSKKYFAFTDEFGDCFIKIPKSLSGEKLIIHSLSYHDKELIINTEEIFHQIQIKAEPLTSAPVTINTVKKNLYFVRSQAMDFDHQLLKKISVASVFQNDVMRNVQMLPGINATNDTKSSIRIRGANEESTLMLLDNMPVYKADHFYGIFGAFNTLYVKSLSIFKNNIPVEYGGRTSGMVKLDSGNDINKFNIIADINLLHSGIFAEVPVSQNFGFKFSARKTYTDLVNSGLYDLSQRENLADESTQTNTKSLIVSKPKFDFYDINGKMVYQKGKHRLDLNSFTSSDRFEDKYTAKFLNRQQNLNKEIFSQISRWKNQTSGANYTYLSNKYEYGVSMYKSAFFTAYDISSSLTRQTTSGLVTDTVNINNENLISDHGAKFYIKDKSNGRWILGGEMVHHKNTLYIENDKNTVFEIAKSGLESSLFGSNSWGKKDGFFISTGLRMNYLLDLNKLYFLPQVYISNAINENIVMKTSVGRQAQYVRQFEHENLLGQRQYFFAMANNNNIPVGVSKNYMLGFTAAKGHFTFDVESYYRWLDGAITHATQSPGLRPPNMTMIPKGYKLFSGEARSYGIDFSLSYDKNALFSMLTYTLSKSENRFKEIFRNQFFPSSDDSRHQVKWINTYTVKSFDFSLNYVGATGRPYLDLSSIKTTVDRRTIIINDYIRKLSPYHRIDMGLTYKFKIIRQEARVGFSVFNVTDRINVKYRQFVFQIPPPPNSGTNPVNTILGSDISQLERTYNISFYLSIR